MGYWYLEGAGIFDGPREIIFWVKENFKHDYERELYKWLADESEISRWELVCIARYNSYAPYCKKFEEYFIQHARPGEDLYLGGLIFEWFNSREELRSYDRKPGQSKTMHKGLSRTVGNMMLPPANTKAPKKKTTRRK